MRISENQDIILGPPGTGKSTTLLNKIDALLERGEAPDRIAFVSFTKKAVQEVIGRAAQRFGLKERQLPMFRTIHSMCFAGLGIGKVDVMGKEHFKELGEWLGYRFEGTWDESEGIPSGSDLGDKLLFLDNLARVSHRPLRDIWEENYTDCDWEELERFQEGYQEYKSSKFLMDFTDMLYAYVAMCDPSPARYVFVDEAQDLSAAQWMVLKHAFGGALQVVIAGDDDQSIYRWSGADVESFLNLEGTKTVLDQSHRIPKTVFTNSQGLICKVQSRFDKKFNPREEEGELEYYNNIMDVELGEGSVMMLVRNTHLIPRASDHMHRIGVPYIGRFGYSSIRTSHVAAIYAVEKLRKNEPITGAEAKELYEHMRVGFYLERGFKVKINLVDSKELFTFEKLRNEFGLKDLAPWFTMLEGVPDATIDYYRLVLSNGYSLRHTPNCTINTIHSAKGGEADHVILFSDMAQRSYKGYEKYPDDERRVAYVGMTRAKKKLSIIQPQTRLYFPYYEECN